MGSCQIEIQIQRQKNKLSIVFDGQELLDLFVEFKLIKKDILKKSHEYIINPMIDIFRNIYNQVSYV